MSAVEEFVSRIRARERIIGYWLCQDSPMMAERLARGGYDYLCVDQQHGLMGARDVMNNLLAIDAGSVLGPRPTVGLVRVGANDFRTIGQVLDAGAAGVIVPMVESADDALRVVEAVRYPPQGRRSYGPVRGELRRSDSLSVNNETTFIAVMIETAAGLEHVEEIADVEGIDALYVGPWDLTVSLSGGRLGEPDAEAMRDEAFVRIIEAAHTAGKAVGVHSDDGDMAAQRLDLGFDFASIEGDVIHLEQIAKDHLERARGAELADR
jgi:4-hydroxy-2-oxoheptanedioate aldolase